MTFKDKSDALMTRDEQLTLPLCLLERAELGDATERPGDGKTQNTRIQKHSQAVLFSRD